MESREYQLSLKGAIPTDNVSFNSPPLNFSLPQTNDELKEIAEVSIKYGLAVLCFGLLLAILVKA